MRNISLSIHWILTEFSRKAFTSIASAGAVVMSFAATFLHAVAGMIIGGGFLTLGGSVSELLLDMMEV